MGTDSTGLGTRPPGLPRLRTLDGAAHTDDDDVESLLERASDALGRGDGEAAMRLAEAALLLEPENSDARAIITFARFRERKKPRADNAALARRAMVEAVDRQRFSGDDAGLQFSSAGLLLAGVVGL